MSMDPTRRAAVLSIILQSLAALVLGSGVSANAQGLQTAVCGQEVQYPVAGGYYLAEPPPTWDGKSALPLVVYFHGWNSSPEGTFRNRALVNAVHRHGAMFVAPHARSGYWRQIGEDRFEGGRDELAYIHTVLADIKTRWPIDEELTMASGFSRGASMVWNVACYAAPLFTAYVPISGGFWNSNPETCPSGFQ